MMVYPTALSKQIAPHIFLTDQACCISKPRPTNKFHYPALFFSGCYFSIAPLEPSPLSLIEDMRDLTCPSLSPTLCLLSSYLPGCYLDLNHYWKSTIIIWDSIAWTDRSSRKKYDATMKITTNIYIRNRFCKIKHFSSWIIRHILFWESS